MVPPVNDTETVAGAVELTVIVIPALVIDEGLAQTALEVMIQVTRSESANMEVVNVGVVFPALIPLTFHWKEGEEPPFIAVAVNVAGEPAHMGFVPPTWVIETEGLTVGVMVM